ncbi:hypothetical protein [Rhizobium sp. SSA_523]|uniref:hypothetical protein n=1 Tax=Rhizobium sp. SSA_523 TaxID=2952477 RepID=UPI00209153C2|nr:hypothetical protein [Rhizobium sp. SSA_523]MCO5733779.1 hypothetical protein [Rhizobium sp. SSA_523]WKC24946.1 hypothetical protein QTJ18_13140 [Rhizobium sp. SSA_523]
MDSVAWYYNEQDKDAPATADIGDLSMYVSRVANCVVGRWVWTGDLPNPTFENPRPAIFGFTMSRDAGMGEATAAALQFAVGGLRLT